MANLSAASTVYLNELRSDERFCNLVNELKAPNIPLFRPKKDNKDGTWEYWSGKKDGFNDILSVLTGTTEV